VGVKWEGGGVGSLKECNVKRQLSLIWSRCSCFLLVLLLSSRSSLSHSPRLPPYLPTLPQLTTPAHCTSNPAAHNPTTPPIPTPTPHPPPSPQIHRHHRRQAGQQGQGERRRDQPQSQGGRVCIGAAPDRRLQGQLLPGFRRCC